MNEFKPIELGDKAVFDGFLSQDPPETSELTFTNLFIWRRRYMPLWSVRGDVLLVVLRDGLGRPFGLPPVGPGDKRSALEYLANQLAEFSLDATIGRVGRRFVDAHVSPDRFRILEDRDNSDYVYLTENLIKLSGNKFHKKKNHLNKFVKNHPFEYRSMDRNLAGTCLQLQESWCELKNCSDDEDLFDEDKAVYEALTHFSELGFAGGVILIDSRVEAFGFGEKLNQDTAVIHVEKANPSIPGLYVAINQQFCQDAWSGFRYVNREQDLGVEGLRKAKQSYHPHHMIDKFTLVPL